jgi:hypothetical protein
MTTINYPTVERELRVAISAVLEASHELRHALLYDPDDVANTLNIIPGNSVEIGNNYPIILLTMLENVNDSDRIELHVTILINALLIGEAGPDRLTYAKDILVGTSRKIGLLNGRRVGGMEWRWTGDQEVKSENAPLSEKGITLFFEGV